MAQDIEQYSSLDLFPAAPQMEAKKSLFSWAVTEGVGHIGEENHEGMNIDFVDVRRPYFHAPTVRVYVTLPEENQEAGKVNYF